MWSLTSQVEPGRLDGCYPPSQGSGMFTSPPSRDRLNAVTKETSARFVNQLFLLATAFIVSRRPLAIPSSY
jgi:hypothetical protein